MRGGGTHLEQTTSTNIFFITCLPYECHRSLRHVRRPFSSPCCSRPCSLAVVPYHTHANTNPTYTTTNQFESPPITAKSSPARHDRNVVEALRNQSVSMQCESRWGERRSSNQDGSRCDARRDGTRCELSPGGEGGIQANAQDATKKKEGKKIVSAWSSNTIVHVGESPAGEDGEKRQCTYR